MMKCNKACLIYTTWPDVDLAYQSAEVFVQKSLVACANVFPYMLSVYPWEGEVEKNEETVMILKTCMQKVDPLKQSFLELHPYEVPCFLVWSLDEAHAHLPYLAWLKSMVS